MQKLKPETLIRQAPDILQLKWVDAARQYIYIGCQLDIEEKALKREYSYKPFSPYLFYDFHKGHPLFSSKKFADACYTPDIELLLGIDTNGTIQRLNCDSGEITPFLKRRRKLSANAIVANNGFFYVLDNPRQSLCCFSSKGEVVFTARIILPPSHCDDFVYRLDVNDGKITLYSMSNNFYLSDIPPLSKKTSHLNVESLDLLNKSEAKPREILHHKSLYKYITIDGEPYIFIATSKVHLYSLNTGKVFIVLPVKRKHRNMHVEMIAFDQNGKITLFYRDATPFIYGDGNIDYFPVVLNQRLGTLDEAEDILRTKQSHLGFPFDFLINHG